MQVPFEGEVELPLKGHLAFKGATMVQQCYKSTMNTSVEGTFGGMRTSVSPCSSDLQALSIC